MCVCVNYCRYSARFAAARLSLLVLPLLLEHKVSRHVFILIPVSCFFFCLFVVSFFVAHSWPEVSERAVCSRPVVHLSPSSCSGSAQMPFSLILLCFLFSNAVKKKRRRRRRLKTADAMCCQISQSHTKKWFINTHSFINNKYL